MIEYEKFKKYMKALRTTDRAAAQLFKKYDDDLVLDAINVDIMCDMLSDMAEDKNGWIHHFLFNCDCDYDSDCAYWFGADGSKNQIDGDRDLYDLITGEINATDERIEPTYRLTEKGEEVLRQIRGFE